VQVAALTGAERKEQIMARALHIAMKYVVVYYAADGSQDCWPIATDAELQAELASANREKSSGNEAVVGYTYRSPNGSDWARRREGLHHWTD